MRKEIQIIENRVVEVEFHTHRFGCRMVERIMSASPEAPTEPFRGKNWYAKRGKKRTERNNEIAKREHLHELMQMAAELQSELDTQFIISKFNTRIV